MSAPTRKVRTAVLVRDLGACVCCGTEWHLEMHHRRRVGAGGTLDRPTPPELLTACDRCNAGFEGDLQTIALASGWKVRSWVTDPGTVPVRHGVLGRWGLLVDDGVEPMDEADAVARMREVYGGQWDEWAVELYGTKG